MRLLLLSLLSMTVGCLGSVYTTYGTRKPIMLGPIRTLGTHLPHGAAVHEFTTEMVNLRAAASSASQQGGYVTTTTTASFRKEGSSKFDAAMRQMLAQHPTCSVRT